MSTGTPIADAIHARTKGGVHEENYIDALGSVRELERENASLREELTTRERLYKEQWQRAEQAESRALAAEKERDAIAGLNQDQFLQLEYLRPVFEAAHALYIESEEYDFDDGLGRGAQQQFWDALASNFEPATEAIDAAIGAKHD